MNRLAISVLLAAALSMSAAAGTGERPAGEQFAQSLNQAPGLGEDNAPGENLDVHRFALQVDYLSYSRHAEWQRLKSAGLTDLQAVRFLLANPRGTDLAVASPP